MSFNCFGEQAVSRPWRPITDYETDPALLADKELRALSGVWIDRRAILGESRSVAEFTERLKREWAIETGLIERLYTLDRGITELMIEHGIEATLIPHHAADQLPAQVAAMIGDQRDAIESIFSLVKGERPLSTGYVRELHGLFTRNQKFAEARDQFGNDIQIPLIRGDYKKQSNNPTRPDGSLHQYCPPEHVAAEMDQLLALHLAHQDKGVTPEVEAAWLHHRFAQIHPFQDGNGRVARALATLVFVKADWLPLVTRDSDRKDYISALEAADRGDLQPLVAFFAKRQRAGFVQAIGIARDIEQATRVDARIDSIKRRLAMRRDTLEREWKAAVATAERMHGFTRKRLKEVMASLADAMEGHGFRFIVQTANDGGPHSHYFHREIVGTAGKLGYYANMRHYRSWVRLVARNGNRGNILISFHCIGHEFQGVLACSGTWFLQAQTDEGGYETGGETALSDEVFQINYKESVEDVRSRFKDWLERVLARGLALWESAV